MRRIIYSKLRQLQSCIKKYIQQITGFYIYKRTELEIGADLKNDIICFIGSNISIILDVGANVGQSAIQYDQWFNTSLIYSFEPFTDAYQMLLSNTSRAQNISAQKIALSDSDEILRCVKSRVLADSTNSLRSPLFSVGDQTENILARRLDTWILENRIKHVDFMKVDVEGYELQVINGAEQTLREARISLVLLEAGIGSRNIWNTPLYKIIDHMNLYGYELIGLYDTSLIQLKNKSHYTNALFASPRLIDSLPPLATKITNKSWPFQGK